MEFRFPRRFSLSHSLCRKKRRWKRTRHLHLASSGSTSCAHFRLGLLLGSGAGTLGQSSPISNLDSPGERLASTQSSKGMYWSDAASEFGAEVDADIGVPASPRSNEGGLR
eukprot:CAMPEP_0115375590 /NCGR_PEP_ID=MMETSP0271-20121206/2539_1 /TAXON_ID=71861 /ORGANISM="Scrippsiella trochoidea, Strain CCMP3099" /LENGTH=110 /DNA_ID=CAMNT_0002798655 /DNA_START=95 /DNA_END=424 /DNA_ORIENTATION=+